MELPSYNNMILSSENTGKEFTIKASAKAFRILSGMYTNKIQAIVREIGCNAFDSHVEAGREDVPFDVFLPNAIEPWFTIKDTGLGLSKEQFETLYSTYFDSTKTSTNAQDGALGLGSKSPFSYTDQYNVVTVHNGIKLNYQLYLGMDGTPEFDLLSEEETDERNGVELRVPVKKDDYREFEEECYRVYQWFTVRPNIHGGSGDYHYVREYETETYGGCLLINSLGKRMYDPGLYVQMGNVLYRASASEAGIEDNPDLKLLNLLLTKKYKSAVVLKAERGDLDILPTREGISFDPRTKAKLLEIAAEADRGISKELEEFFEGKTKISDFLGSDLFSHFLFSESMEFNGKAFQDYTIRPYSELRHMGEGLPREYVDSIASFGRRVQVLGHYYSNLERLSSLARTFAPWKVKLLILVKDVRKEVTYNRDRLKRTAQQSGNVAYFECHTEEDLQALQVMFEDFEIIVKYLSKEIEAGFVEPRENKARRSSSNDPLIHVFEREVEHDVLRMKTKDIISLAECAVERDGHCVVIPGDMRSFKYVEYQGWKQAFPEINNLIAVNQSLAERIVKDVKGAVMFDTLEVCPQLTNASWFQQAFSVVYGASTSQLDYVLKGCRANEDYKYVVEGILQEMGVDSYKIKRLRQASFLFGVGDSKYKLGEKIKVKERSFQNTHMIRFATRKLNGMIEGMNEFLEEQYPLLSRGFTEHPQHAKMYYETVRNSKIGAV